jgi:hypothetical protein
MGLGLGKEIGKGKKWNALNKKVNKDEKSDEDHGKGMELGLIREQGSGYRKLVRESGEIGISKK